MTNFINTPSASPQGKHNWVFYSNPRNKKVKVSACEHCGLVKGPLTDRVDCESLDVGAHRMKKMGWEIMSLASAA